MPDPHPPIHDVLIAGGGPVGLFLACELSLSGRSVLLLEQAEQPHSPLKGLPFGLRGLSVPTIEALDRRGLLDDMANTPSAQAVSAGKASVAAHWTQQARRPAGHFAGIQFYLDDVDASQWPYRLPDAAQGSLAVLMEHIEAVLAARAIALGVEIRRGIGVEDFEQSDDLVTVHTGNGAFHARYLVGCDGGRSAVRKAGGFAFVGTDPEFTGYSVEIELADPDILRVGRHYTPTGMYTYARPGTVAMVEFDHGAFHRTAPVTPDHVQRVLRRVSGTDATVTALRLATSWTDRAFQATTYRDRRVFLAGDAAHIHSPLGGQGLNLGLGDAMNLGWKLAADLRGDAPIDLLDTYTSERHPIGAQILDWSRAQVALMRPSPSTRALEAIVRDLMDTRDGATYFARRVWGVSLRYELGDSHPLVGHSAPDFELSDGTTVNRRLRSGKGLLLDFDAHPSLETIASGWKDRLHYVASSPKERLGLSAMLVRPDGFVAWATNADPDAQEVTAAITRWFRTSKDGDVA